VVELLCKADVTCKSIQLSGPTKICNYDTTYTIKANLNNGCNLKPIWKYDTTAIKILSQNDSGIALQFTRAGNFLLKAVLFTGCTVLEDSIQITVAPKNPKLNLGSDTSLCAGDSIRLNAGSGFTSYQWSTGSKDSSIWVSKAGRYVVDVTNSCASPLKDTIDIAIPILPSLSAGPDTSICTGTLFQRQASGGFATYQWKNLSTQTVVSSGSVLSGTVANQTDFALIASTPIGCIRYDTLTIKALTARGFSLGLDQDICIGDEVQFSAPLGYASYLWNTGATTNSITVAQQGQYILSVLDTNTCSTIDTALIKNVFSLPNPNIGNDLSVCSGSSIVLNPGTFARYLWHNGSTVQSLNGSANGTYTVQVWDNNGCTASDSMQILSQLPLPAGFLTSTDSLCQYEKLTLKPNTAFKVYQWSTGSFQSSIQVETAGNYSLKVTDNNNCVGLDTIRIVQKSCMEGVYIPNAFSPGNDGLNDMFRPLVFGKVKRYQLSVFNRFGQEVFTSDEPMKGWNGTWKGVMQPANAYAWICSYQLEGGTAKLEKGMVLLIR
jgi:gliding motility-associated-like protein